MKGTLVWLGSILLLIGCSNGRGTLDEQQTSPPPSDTATTPPANPPANETGFAIGGTVSGLAGTGLVLRLNGSNDLEIASNGVFSFATRLSSGASYAVAVRVPPSNPTQSCTIANGSGTVASADVTSVRITCGSTAAFSVSGTVAGLFGSGLVLQNNRDDDIGIDANGGFTFPTRLPSGSRYDVTVRTQPREPRQACSVANGSGTIANANVADVKITCAMSDFSIGGRVSGLSGGGLVLLNNGTDELRLDASGSFTFVTALPSGARYHVTIAAQPSNQNQTCEVSNGSGTVGSSNVTSVRVACSSGGYRIGGHVSELRGSGLVLQNNGGDDLPIASNGSYRFVTTLPAGASYNVTVLRQPRDPEQTCEVKNGSGIVRSSDIQNVEVKCERRGRGGDDDDDDDGDDDD